MPSNNRPNSDDSGKLWQVETVELDESAPDPAGPVAAAETALQRPRKQPAEWSARATDMLSQHSEAGDRDPEPTPAPASGALGVGTTIGHYELIRELGRGGMGVVYLARDTKLARRVAIKFLLTEHAELNKRFVVEARTTARCHHENIIVIHDIDTYGGTPFMVLEYLHGQSLREFLGNKPTTPQRAVELMLPVVRALDRAHQYGIVHRDLKPENVFITEDGVVKVLDFGIAKLLSERDQPSGPIALPEQLSRFTRTGALVGTLPYMSPEQLRADDIDHRGDLWAVGIMLYEMVLGKHPLAPLSANKLLGLAGGATAIPSAREQLRDIGELAAVIDRCLIPDREDRTGSARDLLAELEAYLPTRHELTLTGDQSPFAGLAAFQERDAERFYGRSHEIAGILTQLRSQPALTVVGPSGTGKSSLIRAGVIPGLKQSGEGWTAMVLRPGREPLEALADALTDLMVTSGVGTDRGGKQTSRREMVARLQAEPGALGAELRMWAGRTLRRVVLFVDQLEELFTLTADAEQRAAFMRCLEGAADDAASPLRVITTIRSDFLDRAIHQRGFMAEATRGLVFLPPMTRENLARVLTAPVEAVGYRFERPELVETMLDALEETPGALPLLQFAATRLWEARDSDRRLLTQESYDNMGGVAGALASHADAVLAAMSAGRIQIVRAIFQRLVTPERTRAITTLGELRELPGDPGEIEQVVHHLADARLLAIEDSSEASAQVELIHESLITSWPILGRWLDENQGDAEFLARLRTAATEWDKNDRADGLLWRGEPAVQARRWREHYAGELAERETRYLDAVAAHAEGSRRRTRRLRYAGLAGFMLLVLAGAIAFTKAQNETQLQSQRDQVKQQRDALKKQRDALQIQQAALEHSLEQEQKALRIAAEAKKKESQRAKEAEAARARVEELLAETERQRSEAIAAREHAVQKALEAETARKDAENAWKEADRQRKAAESARAVVERQKREIQKLLERHGVEKLDM